MSAPLGGPYRYTREGRGVFHFPLARPWTWALTHHGMWSVFVADVEPARQGVPARRHPLHPPAELMGCWLAIYATREYDAEAVRWLREAHGLEVPGGDVLPTDSYVAVARLAEVSTVGNDYRAFGRDPWWAPRNAPFCRGTIAWWLEEIQYVEPLPSAPAKRLAPVDPGLVPELRERMRLARDKLWRPEAYAVPASLPVPRQRGWRNQRRHRPLSRPSSRRRRGPSSTTGRYHPCSPRRSSSACSARRPAARSRPPARRS
ncbi:hypothetical protein QEG98_28065 [Myxococcus sp. MxC21-1]|uniref:hypothetical protein n=1 Tax=Myxococcus sp. MxC21-1 TaxID=3041439 RepID=UPI00292D1FA5|nr:hypothetical protein [Myxococcus sp. MxC21-1]WNZ59861.1 hypothetical protein QEG98_28065 [Myxococcus sp. MxC21-1]